MENVFPLTLGPHGANIEDVLSKLAPASQALERGITADIQFTAEDGQVVSPAYIRTQWNDI